MHHRHTAIIYAYGEDTPDRGGRQQQIQRCEAYAARHHLQVLEVISEAKSAGPTLSRPAFGTLFAALTTMPTPPSVLLITDMTRLGRSMDLHEVGYLEWRLRYVGITVIDVDAGDLPPQHREETRQTTDRRMRYRQWAAYLNTLTRRFSGRLD